MLMQVSRIKRCFMNLRGRLEEGGGRCEVPFWRWFLEAMLTLDLALESDVQGGDSDTFPGWVHGLRIKLRSRRPDPSSQSRAEWSSRAYGMLVLDVGVTEDLSRRATGLASCLLLGI